MSCLAGKRQCGAMAQLIANPSLGGTGLGATLGGDIFFGGDLYQMAKSSKCLSSQAAAGIE